MNNVEIQILLMSCYISAVLPGTKDYISKCTKDGKIYFHIAL